MTAIMNRLITRPLLLLLALSVVPMAACDDGTVPFSDPEFTVLSHNIYLGADIFQLAQAETQEELVVVAGQLFNHVHSTDFRVRAELLADEIDAEAPVLIGLQEVALYRLRAESDFQTVPVPNADVVVYDFLDLLLGALDDRGLDYRIAASVENADAEMPALLDPSNTEELSDVRLTIHDVILVRSGRAARRGAGHVREHAHRGARERTRAADHGAPLYGPFNDAFAAVGAVAGFTCCFAANLVDDTRQLDERIDYVLYKGALDPLSVDVVGEEESDRDAASGLRPSDHAGVVATFEVR